MNVELIQWTVPNFVVGKMPAGRRQDGFNPDAAPKWALADVDSATLAKQCDDFRAEVFRKAGKPDPACQPPADAGAHKAGMMPYGSYEHMCFLLLLWYYSYQRAVDAHGDDAGAKDIKPHFHATYCRTDELLGRLRRDGVVSELMCTLAFEPDEPQAGGAVT